MKELSVNQKTKIVSNINKQFDSIQNTHKSLVNKCIKLGDYLIEIKAKLGHGNWDNFISNDNSELSFGRIQASKFIKISANKELSLLFFSEENSTESINGICNRIANATDEEKQKAQLIKKDQEEKEAEKKLKKAENKIDETINETKIESQIIDGVFEEIERPKPVPEPANNVVDDLKNEINSLNDLLNTQTSEYQEVVEDNESMAVIFESDDKLSSALAEVKKYKELYRIAQERNTGLMNEKNEAIREIKRCKSIVAKLEKQIKGLSHE